MGEPYKGLAALAWRARWRIDPVTYIFFGIFQAIDFLWAINDGSLSDVFLASNPNSGVKVKDEPSAEEVSLEGITDDQNLMDLSDVKEEDSDDFDDIGITQVCYSERPPILAN
jgi:hypothetical protein